MAWRAGPAAGGRQGAAGGGRPAAGAAACHRSRGADRVGWIDVAVDFPTQLRELRTKLESIL
ncbi:MAG: hypothetical protein ACXV3S_11365, partial [Kineosporiaceae bacterium]